MGIADRARELSTCPMTMEQWIDAQKDPESLRIELVEAMLDPTISYRAVWKVLREDGLPFNSDSTLRNWWNRQPEFRGND